jgi:hypothetical protein
VEKLHSNSPKSGVCWNDSFPAKRATWRSLFALWSHSEQLSLRDTSRSMREQVPILTGQEIDSSPRTYWGNALGPMESTKGARCVLLHLMKFPRHTPDGVIGSTSRAVRRASTEDGVALAKSPLRWRATRRRTNQVCAALGTCTSLFPPLAALRSSRIARACMPPPRARRAHPRHTRVLISLLTIAALRPCSPPARVTARAYSSRASRASCGRRRSNRFN